MSISCGKDNYDSKAFWTERTARALKERGELYSYDLGRGDDPLLPWLDSKIKKTDDILEVGCGFGKWARQLRGKYRTYWGVDVIPQRIEHAKQLTPDGLFLLVEGDWDLHNKFDVIMSITVIQHLTLPEAIKILQAIERHLLPGGIALLAEGRIAEMSVEEAERCYKEYAAHMIPKPLHILKEAAPSLEWTVESGIRFVLRKA